LQLRPVALAKAIAEKIIESYFTHKSLMHSLLARVEEEQKVQ